METAVESAPAKLNLFLEVLGRRPDGYHDLVGVFHELPGLADTLSAARDDELSLVIETASPTAVAPEDRADWQRKLGALSAGADNLVLRALAALRQAAGVRDGLRVVLTKRIPLGAGLGGGSSDAAAALRLGNRLWHCGLSADELAVIGATVGSDVPFFLQGGTCLCEGRGEQVQPLPAAAKTLSKWSFALVFPPWQVNTGAAFAALGRQPTRLPSRRRDLPAFLHALEQGDPAGVAAGAFNRFEEVFLPLAPGPTTILHDLRRAGMAGPWLSGSGPTLWTFLPGTGLSHDHALWREVAQSHRASLLMVSSAEFE